VSSTPSSGIRRREAIWLFGACTSLLGSEALSLAFVVWIHELTGSAGMAGLAIVASRAPSILAPVSGLIVDRVRRSRLLIYVNLAQAAWVCAAMFVHSADHVWLLYIVLVGLNLGAGVESPAASALLSTVAGPDRLSRMTSLFRTCKEIARTIAPGLGVIVGQVMGMSALIVTDALTFLVCAICVWQLRVPEARPEAPKSALLRELVAGAGHILRTPLLRRIIGTIGIATLVFGVRQPVVIYAISHGIGGSPGLLGLTETVVNTGSITGGLWCVHAIDRVGSARLVRIGLALMAIGTLPVMLPHLAALLFGSFLIGVGASIAVVGDVTTVLRHTPSHLQGRTMAAADTVITAPRAISAGVGAAVLTFVPYYVVALAMAVVVGLCAASLTTTRLRTPSPEPSAST
jgi:MFS family permease